MSLDISIERTGTLCKRVMRGLIRNLILKILQEKEAHGYAIIKELEKIIGYRVSSGVIYPHLKKLVKEGLVEVSEIGERKLKVYKITKKGLEYIENHREEIEECMKVASKISKFLKIGGIELVRSIRYLVSNIDKLDDNDLAKIREILNETSRRINEIVDKYR